MSNYLSNGHAMNLKSAHYTEFHASKRPSCADAHGFLIFRDGFEKLPANERTQPECWIAGMKGQLAWWLAANFT